MTAAEALELIKGYAGAVRYFVTQHALDRMVQRGVRDKDLRHALMNGRNCRESDDKWKVDGPDLDGDDLTVVVAIEDGLIVVTVF